MNLSLSTLTFGATITVAQVVTALGALSTQVSARQVEVGQRFSVQVTCQYDDESPRDPRLVVPPGVSVSGPSLSTNQSISIVNGRMERQSSIVATWVLTASAVGRYRLGPASMTVGGQRITDRPVDVEVVAAGAGQQQNRRSRRGLPFDPFDPFGGSDPFSGPMFPPMPGFKIDLGTGLNEIPAHPAELDVAKAKQPLAFLDARVTPKRVVIGEQVRLNVYAYMQPGFELSGLSEPNLDGFLSYRNEHDDLLAKLFAVSIGDTEWRGAKVLSYALFPTKSGELTIGSTTMNVAGRGRLSPGGNAIERKSDPITILVEDPPLRGRPSFYHVGDVGKFKLEATVEPRTVQVGEAVSVQVEVKGEGQLPQRLDPPEQSAVDWLEPAVTQQIEEQRGKIGGARQFAYVVRTVNEGTIDLGEMRFAYFDPDSRSYAVAKAKLGTIVVKPNAQTTGSSQVPTNGTADNDDKTEDKDTLRCRGKLGPPGVTETMLADRSIYFPALAFGPAVVGLSIATGRLRRKLAALVGQRRNSAKSLIDAELSQAKSALDRSELALVPAAVERALHLLIEHRTHLRSRGILRQDLSSKLEASGLHHSLSAQLVELLERCDNLRFVSADLDSAQSLFRDAESVIRLALSSSRKTTKGVSV